MQAGRLAGMQAGKKIGRCREGRQAAGRKVGKYRTGEKPYKCVV